MLAWDDGAKPFRETDRLFEEVFPEDPVGPAHDRGILLEARLLLLLATQSDELIREANRLVAVVA
jgi:hypothetical protein